jgi:hypothetical protein
VVATLDRIGSKDSDRKAQFAAFESLAALPNGDGIPFLIKTARTYADIQVSRHAINALSESEDARARKVLLNLADR